MTWLTEQALIDLTGKVKPSAQERALRKMGIPVARKRPDGSLIVLEESVRPRDRRERYELGVVA